MAVYEKLPYLITDFSAGFQTVNQLQDNFAALHDAFALEHGYIELAAQPNGLILAPPVAKRFGHHNTPRIPRAVVKTNISTTSFGVYTLGALAVAPVVTSVSRMAVGQYLITIDGLLDFYAETEVLQAASTSWCIGGSRSTFGASGSPIGVLIETYEIVSSVLTPTDLDFSAVIYGDVE